MKTLEYIDHTSDEIEMSIQMYAVIWTFEYFTWNTQFVHSFIGARPREPRITVPDKLISICK